LSTYHTARLSCVVMHRAGHVRWEFLPLPVRALQRTTITSIAAGSLHSGCVDKDSNPWLWGHGGHWQLGLGHNTHECAPQQVRHAWGRLLGAVWYVWCQ
jgi:hypothetical protein